MKSAKYLTGIVDDQVEKPESPFIAMRLSHRIWIIGAVVIYLLFIGILGQFNPAPTPAVGWMFLALTVNFSLLLLPLIFYQPSYGWFHPLVFGFFTTLIQHLRKTGVYIDGLRWHDALLGWGTENLTFLVAYDLALTAISLVAYYLGYFFGPRIGVPRVVFSQPRHLIQRMLLIVGFSALVFAVYMQTRGGIAAHVVSWGRGRTTELAGQFYWSFFIQFGLIACLTWLGLDRKAHLKPVFWGCAGTALITNFFTAGSRSIVVYFILLGLLVWQLRQQKIAPGKLLIVFFVSLLTIAVLGEFRNSLFTAKGLDWSTLTEFSPSGSTFGSATKEIAQRSGASSGIIPLLALVPNQVGYLYGSTYLALLTLPIPRVLWAGKPGLVNGLVGETFFRGDIGGVPPGPMGEAYWNFGIVGILVVFFVFGICHQWLAKAFFKYAGEPAVIVLYILTLYLFELTGPSVLVWLTSLLQALLLLSLVGGISFRRRGAKEP